MIAFLAAVAQSLRNLGFEDATSNEWSVTVRGCVFVAQSRRKSFYFCGQIHRSGNVQHAVLDVISCLSDAIAMRNEAEARQKLEEELAALNAALRDSGLKIIRHGAGYILTFSAELETLKTLAEQIIKGQDIVFASLESRLAIFTSEGGFSLN